MLPDIEAEDGGAAACAGELAHERAVLIGRGADAELACGVFGEPCPAGAELVCASGGEFFLKGIKGAEGGIDGGSEVSGGCAGAAWGDDFPEE